MVSPTTGVLGKSLSSWKRAKGRGMHIACRGAARTEKGQEVVAHTEN